jgi:hypothetical protein
MTGAVFVPLATKMQAPRNKNASRERLFTGKSALSAIYCCGPGPGSIMISKGDRY